MKQMPYGLLIGSLIITTFIFGYQLRIFESPLNEASGQNFSNMNNSMWNVIITLSSVGYGELFPKTFYGRIVGIIVCFWGVFIISFFVVTVTNMLEFSGQEERSYDLLVRIY
jgi:potassium intermediate/small conductance calcium-activated channel subfamily N protein 2